MNIRLPSNYTDCAILVSCSFLRILKIEKSDYQLLHISLSAHLPAQINRLPLQEFWLKLYFRIFRKSVEKFKFLWNLTRITGTYMKTCTGLFISPSQNSELSCTTTKTDTAERNLSIGAESLQVFFYDVPLRTLQVSPLWGSHDETWRGQEIRKCFVSLNLPKLPNLTSAASPSVDISSTCKVAQKIGVFSLC
jgi:hypothetical protein